MACRSCDLKRIYRLFEEKKRLEAEEAAKRARKKAEKKIVTEEPAEEKALAEEV